MTDYIRLDEVTREWWSERDTEHALHYRGRSRPVRVAHRRYTDTLRKMGWLVGDTPAWEATGMQRMMENMKSYYLPAVVEQLNQPLVFFQANVGGDNVGR